MLLHVNKTLYYTLYMHIYILVAEGCFERDIGLSKSKKRIGLCIDSKAHADPRRNYIKVCETSLC